MGHKIIGHCWACDKEIFSNEGSARHYITYLITSPVRKRRTPRRNGFALAPYECPWKQGFHVGRNPKTAAIDFAKGRVVNLEEMSCPEPSSRPIFTSDMQTSSSTAVDHS